MAVGLELLSENRNSVAAVVAVVLILSIAHVPFGPRMAVEAARGLVTFAFLLAWSYWLHRLMHHECIDAVPFLRLHKLLHHDEVVGRALYAENVAFECVGNLFAVGGLFLCFVPGLRDVVSQRVVAFYALSYVIVHHVNYNLPGNTGFHAAHHADAEVNVGPSVMDAAFGTYAGEEPEDLTHYAVAMAAAACAVLLGLRVADRTDAIALIHRAVDGAFIRPKAWN